MALYKPDCVSNYCVESEAYILIRHYTYSLRFFRCDLYRNSQSKSVAFETLYTVVDSAVTL